MPTDERLAWDSRGGGAPGLARDTNGGGGPVGPSLCRIPFAERRLFFNTESRAGGGGANAGAAIGATGTFRLDSAGCKRAFSLAALPLSTAPPPFPPSDESAEDADWPLNLEGLGESNAPSPDGEAKSDPPWR